MDERKLAGLRKDLVFIRVMAARVRDSQETLDAENVNRLQTICDIADKWAAYEMFGIHDEETKSEAQKP